MKLPTCRSCGAALTETFANLGMSPLSNSYVARSNVEAGEMFFPLRAYVCSSCWLVQLVEFQSAANIFSDYLYFSSYADTWQKHCEAYSEKIIDQLKLGSTSLAVEVASNDGTLLKHFVRRGIPSLGIEPAENVAAVARAQSVPTETAFFGTKTATALRARGLDADLIAANNVLAHVPDIHDFVEGFRILLKSEGAITFEFPSLRRLIFDVQFDTIYHEHFSYLSLFVVRGILAQHDLRIFDVESLRTHGGSLRIYVCHSSSSRAEEETVERECSLERDAGLLDLRTYQNFSRKLTNIKIRILEFFIEAHRAGKKVVGYGAPAKANTLLNFCGIRADLLEFTVDRNPRKQGMFMPGSRIPIFAPEQIFAARPDYVVILPWNLRDEISASMKEIRDWGGQFVVMIPEVEIFS